MKIAPFLLLPVLLTLAGCSTTPHFVAPTSDWKSYHGQLRYSGDGNPIIGEVIVRTGADHNLEIDFSAGPGFPLMRVRSNASSAFAEGAVAQGRWQGRVKKPTTRIGGWFVLYDVFEAAANRSGDLRGEGWTARAVREAGALKSLDIRIEASGERFQFRLGA